MKRDDQLSFFASGTKWRKYLSLIPYLQKEGVQQVFLFASPASNNLLSASQLLTEAGIELIPVVCEPHQPLDTMPGNAAWSRIFIPHERWIVIPRHMWNTKELYLTQTEEWKTSMLQGKRSCILPEGSSHPSIAPGVATLATELMAFTQQQKWEQCDIWLDGGTLATAAIVALCLHHPNSPVGGSIRLHVVGMVPSTINSWPQYLEMWGNALLQHLDWSQKEREGAILAAKTRVKLYTSSVGASFGSTPAQVMKIIKETAQIEGILLDPIYSAKLFLTMKNHLDGETPCVMVHSGGALTLSGYPHFFPT
jgi:1-aminocyclopropane-1-carboxylate deaminase/D-cysteine desulfhydrase-like pyridoxal-dependent ACC family enzyme